MSQTSGLPKLTNQNDMKAVWFVLLLGVLARAAQYFSNRSIWLDEASLALKITHFSFGQLLCPAHGGEPYMVQHQAAPVGFLLLIKCLITLFGNGELVLRFLPFLCGLASLFLFLMLARRCLTQHLAVFFATAIFASSEFLIYYSAELKPYAVDVAIALALILLLLSLHERTGSLGFAVGVGIAGALAVWFSFPAVFVLGGGILGYLALAVRGRERKNILVFLIPGGLCLLSFILYYFTYLRFFTADAKLEHFWAGMYMPVYPMHQYGIPWYTLKWFYYNFFKVFKNPVGASFPFLCGALSLMGAAALWKTRRTVFALLLGPVLATLIASAVHRYPFFGRMILFLAPVFILFLAAGVEVLCSRFYAKWPLAVLSVIVLLVAAPAAKAAFFTVRPILREEIKPCLAYLQAHRRPGDTLYVYFAAENALRYYAPRYHIRERDYTVGTALVDLNNLKVDIAAGAYTKDLDKLRGRGRVWLLFSHVYGNDEERFLSYLDARGVRMDSFKSHGAAVYLYQMPASP